jgi:5'-nucleotidase
MNNMMNKTIVAIIFFLIVCLSFSCSKAERRLVILHTNDVHSAIEPDAKGEGGFAMRCAIIDSIRQVEGEVLLVDAGDYFQGTPYFNFFGGAVEIEAMNKMGYDVITLGNHEFDNGVEALVEQISLSKAAIVSANYDVSKTDLNQLVLPYTIVEKQELKVGVFGLGVNPEGLIKEDLFGKVSYIDPVTAANETALKLKKHYKCDVVVCLSHLGYRYANEVEKIGDSIVAVRSSHIDVIIGGHTHDLIVDKKITNQLGREVTVAQMGRNGRYLGKIEIVVK